MAPKKDSGEEFEIISKYLAPISGAGSFELSDDVATLMGRDHICSKDLLIEGVHFFSDDPPDLIARKALRVNISDIAAKGAQPLSYLLGCAYSAAINEDWIKNFVCGLKQDQDHYGIHLLGGDTTRHQLAAPLVISVTIFGQTLSEYRPVMRSGAAIGDELFVTGTIGDAGLGLQVRNGELNLSPGGNEFLKNRYLLPDPKTGVAEQIAQYATSSMDISDGLIADAGHLCAASEVSMEINSASLPFSDAADSWLEKCPDRDAGLAWLAGAGDDYEILCTIPTVNVDRFQQRAVENKIRITRIGRCVASVDGPKVTLVNEKGTAIAMPSTGYNHFAKN